MLSVLFAGSIIAFDLQSFEEYTEPRSLDGAYYEGKVYLVYQDYGSLYASMGLVIWDPESDDVETHVILEADCDVVRPQIYVTPEGLMVSWFEVHEGRSHHCWGALDPDEQEVTREGEVEVDYRAGYTGFGFSDGYFVVSRLASDGIRMWRYPREGGTVEMSSIPIDGEIQKAGLNNGTKYAAVRRLGTTYLNTYPDGVGETFATTGNEVTGMSVREDYQAWIEHYPGVYGHNPEGETFGKLVFRRGDSTDEMTIRGDAWWLTSHTFGDSVYLAWLEWTVSDLDDDDEDYEVHVARVPLAGEPKIFDLGVASAVDGRMALSPFFLEVGGELRLFWDDADQNFGIQTALVRPNSLGGNEVILENGETPFWIILPFILVLAMGSMFAFIFMMKAEGAKRQKKETKEKFGDEPAAPMLLLKQKDLKGGGPPSPATSVAGKPAPPTAPSPVAQAYTVQGGDEVAIAIAGPVPGTAHPPAARLPPPSATPVRPATQALPAKPALPVSAPGTATAPAKASVSVAAPIGAPAGPSLAKPAATTPPPLQATPGNVGKDGEPDTRRGKRFDFELKVANDRSSYMFLKFFFAAVPFVYVGAFMGGIGIPMGVGLGFRVGYGNIIAMCGALVATSWALMGLRSEVHASREHTLGYGVTALGFLIALVGLLWYESQKTSADAGFAYIIAGAAILSAVLSVVGPLVMLYALTRSKAFLVQIVPFIAALGVLAADMVRFSTYEYLPTVQAASRLMVDDTAIVLMLVFMFSAILMAMTLFEALSVERIKPVETWTKEDIKALRGKALVLSLAATGFMTFMFVPVMFEDPMPDPGSLDAAGPLIGIALVMVFLIGILVKMSQDEDMFKRRVKSSPTGAIFGAYLTPVMVNILFLLFVLFLGALALVILLAYAYLLYRAHMLTEGTWDEAMREAAGEKVRKDMPKPKVPEVPLVLQRVKITRVELEEYIRRNLRWMVAGPPMAAVVMMLGWASGFFTADSGEVPSGVMLAGDALVVLLVAGIFAEIPYVKGRIATERSVKGLAKMSMSQAGVMLFGVVAILYALFVSRIWTIVVLVAIFQAFCIAYVWTIYPPLLDRLNREPEEFFVIDRPTYAQMTGPIRADEKMYAIPGEEMSVPPAPQALTPAS